ncbi:Pectinesterase inhibitor 5 [Cardamine amara subsp. amara]|uniref:Pectinesterase inhibitor 5 n=1 Tax=Cardamine amara subsp. amara TaxID=228776 RepID=A0ABD0Z7M2_CARAN
MNTKLIILKNSLSLLISLVLFAFPTANAIPEAVSFCKETLEIDFCAKYIGYQRIEAARDFSDLYLIAVSETKIEVNDAITQINRVRQKFNGLLGKNRISVCEKKYKIAATSFHKSLEVGKKKSKSITDFAEMSQRTQAGFEAVHECEDEWSKHGPRQQSPLTFYFNNIQKLCQITRVIINKFYA